jgi:hypothetical protein
MGLSPLQYAGFRSVLWILKIFSESASKNRPDPVLIRFTN